MTTRNKLILAIERSEAAYSYYIESPLFFKAQRIYNANRQVYYLLESYIFEEEQEKEAIFQYLFHLDDWFGKFQYEITIRRPKPEDNFLFECTLGAIEFPKSFVSILKRKV